MLAIGGKFGAAGIAFAVAVVIGTRCVFEYRVLFGGAEIQLSVLQSVYRAGFFAFGAIGVISCDVVKLVPAAEAVTDGEVSASQ